MFDSRTGRWSLGTALLCVVLLAATWFLLISPRRAEASDLGEQAAAASNEALMLQQQLARLKEQYAGLAEEKARLKAIQAQLPPDADVAALLRDLQDLATTAGVSLDSIAPGLPAVLGADGSTGPSAGATAGAGSVVRVPLEITVSGQYFEDSLYLKYLQTRMTRSILISGLTTAPSSTAGTTSTSPTATPSTAQPAATGTTTASQDLTLTISASVFVLLDGSSSLEDVKAEAKKAAVSATTSATR
jgi:type IV pilus assembly PilO-like protein